MTDLARPLAVVAHDAGAANLILAWLAAHPVDDLRAVMAGPAAALWAARFPDRATCATIGEALDGAAMLLSGTGWASDLEHAARKVAAQRGIRSVAVIDHWVNYRARFERDGETVLPDEIWVADEWARAIAQADLPEVPATLHPNAYLAEQATAAGPVPAEGDLLFLAEPARSDWGGGSPGEFQALDYLAMRRAAAGIGHGIALRIRPHPSDPQGKYDDWIAAHPGTTLDTSPDLAGALRGARHVAGMNSAALPIALAAGRSTIVALPPNAPPCVLPHAGLIHLRDLA